MYTSSGGSWVSGEAGSDEPSASNGVASQKPKVNPWANVEMITDTDTRFVLKLLVVSFAGKMLQCPIYSILSLD
jgi:hypothetical protein